MKAPTFKLPSLGYVASSKRSIKSGTEYNQYFNLNGIEGNEITLIENGNVEQTISEMKKMVKKTLSQTQRIALKLKGTNRLETARNIWNFVYQHIQHKKDHPLREQLRTPLRTWRDRSTGVDCDCYSIFISTILTNLGIDHSFRIAAYGNGFQHVYVMVPNNGSEIIIDCVADKFNYEVPYTKKKDFTVMGSSSLNGFNGQCRANQPAIVYMNEETLSKRGYVFTSAILKELGVMHTETINNNGNVPEIHVAIGGKNNVLPTALTREKAAVLKANIMKLRAAVSSKALGGFNNFFNVKNIALIGGAGLLTWLIASSGSNDTPPAAAKLSGHKRKAMLPIVKL